MSKKIRKQYSRVQVRTKRDPERRTKAVQSERDNQNINNIVGKAIKTGQLPVLVGRQPIERLPNIDSYQDAMDKIARANSEFEKLPSLIRREFDNDPSKLLAALENPKENLDLLQKASVLEPVQEVIDPVVAELQKIEKAITSPETPKKTAEQPPQS